MQHRMIQMPESQMGSLRIRPSQLRIDVITDDQQLSSNRRNFMSPTALPLFRELQYFQITIRQYQQVRQNLQQQLPQNNNKPTSNQSQIVKSLFVNIFLQGFFINYYFFIYCQYSFRYVLLQLWIQDLLTMFILIYFNYRKGEECVWQLIETMFLFFLKVQNLIILVFIVFYYEIQKFKIYYITIMMICLTLLVLVMRIIQKFKFNYQNNQQIIQQFVKALFCAQLTLITLKWEDQIEWAWSQIFIILWVFLVVFALLLFISFIGCIETIINLLKKQTNNNYLIGNIWIFIHLFGYTLFPFIFLYRISQFYDYDLNIDTNECIQLIIVTSLYIFILFGFTLFFINQLLIFLKEMQGTEIVQINELNANNNNNQQQNEETSEVKSQKINAQKKFKFIKLNAPLYLVKLSATYFAIFDKIINKDGNNLIKQTELMSQRGTALPISNRMEYPQEMKGNSNSLEEKSNNLMIDQIQIQKSDEQTKQIHKKPQDSDKTIKSEKSQTIPQDDQQSQSQQEKCLVCFENQANILFIPCRHGGICQLCAEDIMTKQHQCYLCRKNIKQILKIDRAESQLIVNEISNIKQNKEQQQI